MTFNSIELKKKHSFLEYVFGGCEIGLNIAIDFTGSNGSPKNRSSLHYTGDMANNEYLNAIKSVGSILQYYDSDKQIPVFGYGAAINKNFETSHCFALNGNIFDPEVNGIDGVEDVYKRAINNVSLSGPTNFASIIKLINEMTESGGCTQ